MAQRAFRVKVEGMVQRRGYRRFVLDTAQELGTSGYVRNEKDGSVTVFVQGGEPQVNQFLDRIKKPEKPVIVKSFKVEDMEPNPQIRYFEIEFGSLAEELQEGFGSMEREFRDYREEFRGFAKRTNESLKRLEDRYGEISVKLTEVLETLRRESMETRKELIRAVDALTKLIRQFVGKRNKPSRRHSSTSQVI